MKSKVLSIWLIIPVVFACSLLMYSLLLPPRSATTIRIHDDQIDIQKFTNAIAAFIIKKGYGYRVEKVESTVKEIRNHLVTGKVDITLELWKENHLVWYHKSLGDGSIQDLGVLYSGGRQYWIIPKWYALEKNIKTVFDMSRHWRDFANPEDPSKGIFFNCIFGWVCRDINKVKLKAYGLDRYYNTVSPISPEALQAIYESAMAHRLPVFGYYWEPNAIMSNHNWYILKEPEYTEAVWMDIMEASKDPDTADVKKACAFNNNAVHKIAGTDLVKKAPDVAAMFEKMKINIVFFNNMLEQMEKNPEDDALFDEQAQIFLKHHPDQWNHWVSDDARKKIEKALAHISTPGNEN